MSQLKKMLAATIHGAGRVAMPAANMGLRYLDYIVSVEESMLMEALGRSTRR